MKPLDYKGSRLKSPYELLVALLLDMLELEWVYEPRVFPIDNDGHSYVPDFYLPLYDLYLEAKGPSRVGKRAKGKIKAFRNLGYNLEVVTPHHIFKLLTESNNGMD